MDRKILFIAILCLVNSCISVPLQVYFESSKERAKQSAAQKPALSGAKQSAAQQPPEPKARDIFEIISKENEGSSKQLHEGDVVVPPGRNAIKCADNSCFWPKSSDGTVPVPYTLSSSYSASDLAAISDAMQEFATVTCIRFVPQTTETNYLTLQPGDGCSSMIGKVGGGQQVALSYGCMNRGTIEHELNHALGFFHEHSRSDRDDHVTIMTDYISPNDLINFIKADTNNQGFEYDFASIMHYASTSFSNTSGKATIIPKPDPNTPIGQTDGLSNLDVSKINALYRCDMCAFMLAGTAGSFLSSNYPSMYPNNANCTYLIRVPSDKVVLQFDAFDVQSSDGCTSDYIKIYDGLTRQSPVLLDKACGSGAMPPLMSSGIFLLLEFVTDGSVPATGFKVSYSNPNCGGTYTTSTGSFTSPYYPNKYRENMNCGYYILAPAGSKVSLTFSSFSVEDEPTCSFDYLSIFDGAKTTSPLYGKYCGSNLPPPVTSTGNFLQLQFHSDDTWNMPGFQATYTFVNA